MLGFRKRNRMIARRVLDAVEVLARGPATMKDRAFHRAAEDVAHEIMKVLVFVEELEVSRAMAFVALVGIAVKRLASHVKATDDAGTDVDRSLS